MMVAVLRVFVGCCTLVALVCWPVAAYCWFNAASHHAEPGAGDRFMKVGLWTNLTPDGNRLHGWGFKFLVGGTVAFLVGVGLTLLLRAVG